MTDETAGRIEASRRGIQNIGTLGVLRAAAVKDYVDLPTALARLLETNFRVATELIGAMLAEDAERRRRTEVAARPTSGDAAKSLQQAQPFGDLVPTGRHQGRQPSLILLEAAPPKRDLSRRSDS